MVEKSQLQETLTQIRFLAGDATQLDAAAQCVLLVHSLNVACKDAALRCTGVMEDDPEDASTSYELPPAWHNALGGVYSLRYRTRDNKVCLFKFIKMGNLLNVNCSHSDELFSVTLNTASVDPANASNAQTAEFVKQYEQEILAKFVQRAKSGEEQKNDAPERNRGDDFFWNPANRNPMPLYVPPSAQQQQQRERPFGDYGRTDLDPFAMGPGLQVGGRGGPNAGGGNLMGPDNPIFSAQGGRLGGNANNNPLGADPQHFRYDPTGPGFDIEPDNDIFLPPGQPRPQVKKPNFGGFGGPGNQFPRGGFGFGGGGGGNLFM